MMIINYTMLIPIPDRINISSINIEDFLFYLLHREHPIEQITLQRDLGLPTSVIRMIKQELSDVLTEEKALPTQYLLTEMGLLLEEIRPRFNKYFSAQSIGCQSSFMFAE